MYTVCSYPANLTLFNFFLLRKISLLFRISYVSWIIWGFLTLDFVVKSFGETLDRKLIHVALNKPPAARLPSV